MGGVELPHRLRNSRIVGAVFDRRHPPGFVVEQMLRLRSRFRPDREFVKVLRRHDLAAEVRHPEVTALVLFVQQPATAARVIADTTRIYRGEVFGSEYLGTLQIVTVKVPQGRVKVKVPASLAVKSGEQVGLAFLGDRLSLFDKGSGRAIRSALHDGAAHG